MMRISGYMINVGCINKWLALSISNSLSLPIFIDLRSSIICDMISCHQAWALFPNLINHWHYFNCFSFLIGFSFDSSIINCLSTRTNYRRTLLFASLCLKWSIVLVEFFVCQFYILLLQYQSSYQKWLLFYLQQRLVVPKWLLFL
jgi:hypothetical protein